MGAKLYGARATPDNDNLPPLPHAAEDAPLKPEDRRVPPVIEVERGLRWYLLITVPQGEYRCADALKAAGVTVYVPTQTTWPRRIRERESLNVETQTPAFRGYVFARLSSVRVETDQFGIEHASLGDDWHPLFARDAWGKSRLGIQSIVAGQNGRPAPVPLVSSTTIRGALPKVRVAKRDKGWRQFADERPIGLIALADAEREGWWDDRKRPDLEAELAGRKRGLAVEAGDDILITAGPFAGLRATAENDNDENGNVRVMRELLGRMTRITITVDQLENLARKDSIARSADAASA